MDISRVLTTPLPENTSGVARDPLRLLPTGSVITVSIATDPQTGSLGILYNNNFYSVESLKDPNVGQFLKVVIQSNEDRILLKLLHDEPSAPQSQTIPVEFTLPEKAVVLTSEEKKLLRNILVSFKSSEEDSRNIPDPRTAIENKLKNLIEASVVKLIPQNAGEELSGIRTTTRLTSEPRTLILQNEASIEKQLNIPAKEVGESHLRPTVKRVSDTKLSELIRSRGELFSSQPESQILQSVQQALPTKEILLGLVKKIATQLIQQLAPVLSAAGKSDEEIFRVIQSIATKHLEEISTDQAAQVRELGDEIAEVFKGAIQGNALAPSIQKTKKSSIPSLNASIAIDREEANSLGKIFLEPLQRAISQLVLTTESLQKIHTANPTQKNGVFFIVPFYLDGKMHQAQTFLFQDNPSQKKERKKRPKLIKLKLDLPLFGEIAVDVLLVGNEVQLNFFVSNGESQGYLQEAKKELTDVFLQQGISLKAINISISRKASLVPDWISTELGIEQMA